MAASMSMTTAVAKWMPKAAALVPPWRMWLISRFSTVSAD
jgi:hypothetical protein